VVARLVAAARFRSSLIADYCWNVALDADNRGLWLAAVMGDLGTSRARAEYTYAKIDKDATVAAFNSDDFFWGTGLGRAPGRPRDGHGEEQLRPRPSAQWQRFKDSPDPVVREQWVTRYRLEWRTTF